MISTNKQFIFRTWQVIASDPENQLFYVNATSASDIWASSSSLGIPATLVSPEPYDQLRTGRFEHIEPGTIVMVLLEVVDNFVEHAYILGYVPLINTSGTYGRTFVTGELGPGERRDVGPTGLIFERKRSGVFRWFYNHFCNFTINRVLGKITGLINSIIVTFRTGKFSWEWRREDDYTDFRLFLTRGFLPHNEITDRPIGSESPVTTTDTYHDRVDLRGMDATREDGRVVIFETRQATGNEKIGTIFTQTKIGRNDNSQPLIESTAWDKNENTKIITQIMGEDLFSIDVNEGEVNLKIDNSGTVTLKINSDSANILLGGKNAEQQLLTKKYHDMWAKNHIHSTSTPGAPTGPPLIPVIPDTSITRGINNWCTHITKAE